MLRQLKIKSLTKLSNNLFENNEVYQKIRTDILNCLNFTPVLRNTKLKCGQMCFMPPSENTSRSSNLIMQTCKTNHIISVPAEQLIEAVLVDISTKKGSYGMPGDDEMFCGDEVRGRGGKQNIIVEYSSPNIAKPFHAGHLRSTVIGRFVANINKWFKHNVTSINYLGDWGTQFGYIAEGFKRYGSNEDLQQQPIQHLFNVYVKMHEQSEVDPSVHHEAMSFFNRLERGDEAAMEFWRMCRDASVDEYNSLYKRLDVEFDSTIYESMFSKQCLDITKDLEEKQVLLFRDGVGYLDVTMDGDQHPMHAPLIKSDGSSLYLTRDLASALKRYQDYKAHKLYYVVENGQQHHFKLLRRCLQKFYHVALNEDMHVKFGRVEGMSTRRGRVVWLSEVLDEARSIVKERMLSRSTTKVSGVDVDEVAELLGVCGVVVFDLKQSRMNNYRFSWSEALNFNGDTGIFLQYTHARLHSLIEKASHQLKEDTSFETSLLHEDIIIKMCQHLARFDEVLLKSYNQLEACHLVHYLFQLSRMVNVAHGQLRVVGQPHDVAQTRLVLFKCAKQVMFNGMKILGLQPLNKI